jgi:hypothetical protein
MMLLSQKKKKVVKFFVAVSMAALHWEDSLFLTPLLSFMTTRTLPIAKIATAVYF